MPKYINKNNIIEASISEPYQNCGESWDIIESHGWRLILVVGFQQDGYPNLIKIDYNSEEECKEAIKKLDLTEI